MKNRKAFLAQVSAMGMLLAAPRKTDATEPASSPSPRPVPPEPAATAAAAKPPSEAALAVARTMRRFDPELTDAQIDRIARDVDANLQAGRSLRRRGRTLKNSDEPVTTYRVP